MTNEDPGKWRVVINEEDQYSIWFVDRDPPAGWNVVDKEGSKEECLAFIDEVWTDMRPKSLRIKMDDAGAVS